MSAHLHALRVALELGLDGVQALLGGRLAALGQGGVLLGQRGHALLQLRLAGLRLPQPLLQLRARHLQLLHLALVLGFPVGQACRCWRYITGARLCAATYSLWMPGILFGDSMICQTVTNSLGVRDDYPDMLLGIYSMGERKYTPDLGLKEHALQLVLTFP